MGKQNSISGKKETAYDHVLKYTGLFGGVQGLTILLSVIRNKCVAVLIGVAGMGLVDLYNRILDLVSNSTNFGISFSAVKHISELYERGDRNALVEYVALVRSWSLLAALLGTAVCCLLSPVISYQVFDSYDFIPQLCVLSPIVGMLAICGGEMAVFKGVRRLKRIALISVVSAVFTLVLTVTVYYFMGSHGIVPVLVGTTLAVTLVQLHYSCQLYPYRVTLFPLKGLSKGLGMIRLGISFLLAGVAGSGAEMLVRGFIFDQGSLTDVGIYSTGFVLTVTYARLVFVALDADYFPRLSGAFGNRSRVNGLVNSQLEVCVLLMAPFLVFFVLVLPYIVPLLYSGKFMAAVPFAIVATFYMFFKAVASPIAYMSLAKGDSVVYFLMELVYDIIFVALVVLGYAHWGLIGAGIGLSLSNAADMFLVAGVYGRRYGFRFSARAIRLIAVQFVCVGLGVLLAWQSDLWIKYGVGVPVLLVSGWFSLHILRRETTLASSLKGFIRTRLIRTKHE